MAGFGGKLQTGSYVDSCETKAEDASFTQQKTFPDTPPWFIFADKYWAVGG